MLFKYPFALFIIPAIAVIVFFLRRRKVPEAFTFSSGMLVEGLRITLKQHLSRNLIFMRGCALCLMAVALARPQSPVSDSRIETEGIDIVIAIDCSTSMLAEDFVIGGKRQNRLEAVKRVVDDFIEGRQSDRIGIVAFAARAYTVSPLTLDYGWVTRNLERVKIGLIEDGTAIGSGLATSVDRLRKSTAKSKVVILLTDGRNNAGTISPSTAAEIAKALGIKVYTIGAGSKGAVPYPVRDFFGNIVYQNIQIDIDEETLQQIASETSGKYYRATDTGSLRKIYDDIDDLEKTPIEERGYSQFHELFPYFLLPGIGLIVLEIIASNTFLRKIP